VLSTLGVVIIVFRGDPNEILALNLGMGDILVLCGCVAWAIYTSFLRIRGTIRPIVFVFLTFCVGVMVMAPFSLHELWGASLVWTPQVIGAFAYVGIFPSVCAYFLYNDAVARLGPGPAGQTISLMPIFGALLATQLLAEKLYLYHGLGIAAILTGIVVTWTLRPRTDGDAS
jgi:drug/metabolite transporter (DMT)-like permease